MLSMKCTFTTPYRPQSNGLCELMNQTIKNIIECTVKDERNTWDKSPDLVMMAYRATPQTLTVFSPNMLVTGNEMNIPMDLIYVTPKSRIHLENYECFCSHVEELRNSLVDAYFRTRKCLGDAAVRQKMYYDSDTARHHFKKGDWVIYWHKPTAMQTLSSGWTCPFVVDEKVSVVGYRIQLRLDGSSKVVHVDQLILDPCHQERTNWIRDKLARKIMDNKVVDKSTDPIRPQQMTVGVSIACQTSDTDPIVISNDIAAPTIIVCRSLR